jgi:circadian clock protein KaiC
VTTDEGPPADLERLSTGSPALDRSLGGGLPTRSVTVISGQPGSGKTIFTLQIMFHLARQGRRGVGFSTLSEPALKLIRYIELFPVFDVGLLDDRLAFVDLGSELRKDGAGAGDGERARGARRPRHRRARPPE